MTSNIFFEKKKISLQNIFKKIKFKKNFAVDNILPLSKSEKNDLTFFDSIKYKADANLTKSRTCITTQKLEKFLPKKINKIIVKNVLFELSQILKKIYLNAEIDYPDETLKKPIKNIFKSVKFGNNVLIGKNVKIGRNCEIGSNSIIEKNVIIGEKSVIGYGSIIRNSIIGKNVVIQDNCKIGQKGFGFVPLKGNNLKFPHIGKVVIKDNVEIASGCTIDRGSVDDTIIGENTYLDNLCHVAHNVEIGNNSAFAAMTGIAGSAKVGNHVLTGGQAGIAGHIKIGNNVHIAAKSGVFQSINDGETVMGNPAVNKYKFLKNYKKIYGK